MGRNSKKGGICKHIADSLCCTAETLVAKSEEELKSLLLRVKEESKEAGLKLSIKKTKITASIPITSWQIEGEKVEAVTEFIFLGSKNHCGQ